jgi:hypothetical protein
LAGEHYVVKIDNTSELISALRSQLATRAEGLRNVGNRTVDAGKNEVRNAGPVSVEELRRRVGREIASLDMKLPANRRRARIIFIESVLTWDFGDELLNDPQFDFFVRDVEESLNANPDVAASLDKVLSQLHTN